MKNKNNYGKKKLRINLDDIVIPSNIKIEIRDNMESVVLNCIKKNGFACVSLLESMGLPTSTSSYKLAKMNNDENSPIIDLGYKNIKLPGRRMYHLIHVYGLKKQKKKK